MERLKIAFFTEGLTHRPVSEFDRNHANARTDVAWQIALKSHHWRIDSLDFPDNEYDLGIFIIPKNCTLKVLANIRFLSMKVRKWAIMQEGPNDLFQDLPIEVQFQYLSLLEKTDCILCHNEIDRKYYQGIFQYQEVAILPSLMIEDSMPEDITSIHKRSGTMIGGNFCSWYGGIDSYMIAQLFEEDIWAPSMGRKQEDEQYIEDINYITYRAWKYWITELSKRKYAVHLMRTYAAGTFALNCAYLGIPCIGWNSLDTQSTLFPELSFNEGDMISVRKAALHLKTNKQFYDSVSFYAKTKYEKEYSEEAFLKKIGAIKFFNI